MALEDRLNEIVSQGDQALRNGNAADAIMQYENALELVRNQPLLTEQRNRVMGKLATGYMSGNRASDAISVYSTLLDAHRKDCQSESSAVSDCADAQYKLGVAKVSAGDFLGALTSLREAGASYAKAEGFSDFHDMKMIQVKDQAQTNLWVAVALFRLGRTSESITAIEAAISVLSRVRADDNINIGIRDDAARSLQEAQTLLTHVSQLSRQSVGRPENLK